MTTGASIPVGYVRRAHGIRGDVLVRGLGADASDRLGLGKSLTTNESPPRSFDVTEYRPHKTDFIVHLSGIDDRTAADELVGVQFVIDRSDRRTLEPDEWWIEDVIGCVVVDPQGTRLGIVTDVAVGAAQDRLVIAMDDGGRAEVPLVDELVPQVDVDSRSVVVDLIDGLVEEGPSS